MRKRLFLDTNVMYDFIIERAPHFEAAAAKIMSLAELQEVTIFASSLSFATTNYFTSKEESATTAKEKLRKFRALSQGAAVSESTIDKALASFWKDFEDALQYFSAVESHCEVIITRNGKDFEESLLPVMTTAEFLPNSQKNI